MKKNFVQYYQRYQGEIFGYIKRIIPDSEIAKDLCQDVFLKALQTDIRFKDENHIRNWFYITARNHTLNFLKHQKIRSAYFEEKGIENRLLDNILPGKDESLINAFRQLKENQQQILYLREIAGYSYNEIAGKTGKSVTAVTSLLSRARKSLKEHYIKNAAPKWMNSADAIENFSSLLRLFTPWDQPVELKSYIEKKIRQYFDKVHKEWEQIRSVYINEETQKRILEKILPQYENAAIDLGTGTGKMARSLKGKFKYLIGIDNNFRMMKEAGKYINDSANIYFAGGNLENIPVKNDSVKTVICNMALHHIVEMQKTLNEAARILQKNGQLLIVDFYRHDRRTLWEQMRNVWLGFHPVNLKKQLLKSGFTGIKSGPVDSGGKTGQPRLFYMTALKS